MIYIFIYPINCLKSWNIFSRYLNLTMKMLKSRQGKKMVSQCSLHRLSLILFLSYQILSPAFYCDQQARFQRIFRFISLKKISNTLRNEVDNGLPNQQEEEIWVSKCYFHKVSTYSYAITALISHFITYQCLSLLGLSGMWFQKRTWEK